jgi:hypothetical protein
MTTINLTLTKGNVDYFTTNKYSLCLFRGVQDPQVENDVAWVAIPPGRYLTGLTSFHWEENYQVYTSNNSFQSGVTIDYQSDFQNCSLGSNITIETDGSFSVDPNGTSGQFFVKNTSAVDLTVGFNQLITTNTGTATTPIYVSPIRIANTTGTLTAQPILQFTLAWIADFQTATMTSNIEATNVVFTFAGTTVGNVAMDDNNKFTEPNYASNYTTVAYDILIGITSGLIYDVLKTAVSWLYNKFKSQGTAIKKDDKDGEIRLSVPLFMKDQDNWIKELTMYLQKQYPKSAVSVKLSNAKC